MKEKIILFLMRYRADIALCIITLIPTLLAGVTVAIAGGSELASVALSASTGALTLSGLYTLANWVGFVMPHDRFFGIVGIIAGTMAVLAFN